MYTRGFGKLAILAREANKITSKLASHMEIGVITRLMIASGKGFDILAQARIAESFSAIRLNAEKLNAALGLIEALDKLTEVRHEDPAVFYLLERALAILSQSGRAIVGNLLYHYLLHLLMLLGHAPAMKDERVLQALLVAEIGDDDILVEEEARKVIDRYLRLALDEKQLFCFGSAIAPSEVYDKFFQKE